MVYLSINCRTVYESCLFQELILRGLKVQRQVAVPIIYKGKVVRDPLIIDILLEDKLIVEVKATEKDCPLYKVQLLTYLRLTSLKLGILINFGKESIKEGISRMYPDKPCTVIFSETESQAAYVAINKCRTDHIPMGKFF